MALFNEAQVKKNIATGQVSATNGPQNMVQFGKQANLTTNNQINQKQLTDGYRKARSEGLVSDLPSYVKELRTYGVTVEGWDQAIKTKAKNDIEQQKQQKMLNAPRYKNLLMGVKDSMLSIPSSIQELGLAGVSNIAEGVATGLGREDLAQRFDEAQQKTQQQMNDFGDIGQNKESGWYKGGKMAGDIGQSFAVGAGVGGLLQGTKAMQVVNNVANVGQIYKNVTLGKVGLGALGGMGEQVIYSGIADKRLPTSNEMKFAGGIGAVVPLLPLIPAGYRAIKGPARTADDLVLQITQSSDKREVKNLMDALSEFDLSKADDITFEGLATNANDKIQVLARATDEIAGKSGGLVDDLAVVTTKEGDDLLLNIGEVPKGAIVRNYVKEGIELLKGHYDEIGDNQMVLELQSLASKKVLTGKDINRLAKIIPSDQALTPFKTTGMPKTGVLAQRVENLRKGLKTTLRQLDPQNTEVLTQLDSRMSKLIGLRDQMQQNIVGLQKLKNKIVPRTLGEKVGRMLSNVLNTITMGSWQGFVTGSLRGNVGNKVLNYIDVEKQMAKNLKLLSKMDDFIELGAKQNVDELMETMARETGYSVDDIARMAEDVASVDELAKQADITPQVTEQLDNVASPTTDLGSVLKNATDEELKANGFTATMIKQFRKKNPLTKVGTTESATQSIAEKADDVLQTATPLSKVDDALPVGEKMGNTTQKAKSLESADLTTSIKKAKADGKTFDEFVKDVETPKTIKLYRKSAFSDGGKYVDVPVIRRVDNTTLYQGGESVRNRQHWTANKKYAEQFGEVIEKKGSFYQIDNGNRMTDVYVEAPSTSQLRTERDKLDNAGLPALGKTTSKPLVKANVSESADNLVGDIKKVGDGYEVSYMRNTEKSPNLGSKFGQDIEPAGQYFSISEGGTKGLPDTYEVGTKTLKKPLVIERKSTDATGRKGELSKKYGGKTGKNLSKAIVADGYDGIITWKDIGGKKYTSESVDLTSFIK